MEFFRRVYGRRAVTLVFLSALILTVAAEVTLKDGTRMRLSNEEVEKKLQVRRHNLMISCTDSDLETGVFVRPKS